MKNDWFLISRWYSYIFTSVGSKLRSSGSIEVNFAQAVFLVHNKSLKEKKYQAKNFFHYKALNQTISVDKSYQYIWYK